MPASLSDWTDTHALRALRVHGHDLVGNLLFGDIARDRFLSDPLPLPVPEAAKAAHYPQLAMNAAGGDMQDAVPSATIRSDIDPETCRRAARLACDFLDRMRHGNAFRNRFAGCVQALEKRIAEACAKIAKLG